jgi:hypothetical protein
MSGKGDQRRKQDLEKYGKNYAEIFKKFDFTEAVQSIKDRKQKNSYVDDRPTKKNKKRK